MKYCKPALYILFPLVFQFASAQYAYQKAEIYLLKSDFTSAKDIKDALYLLEVAKRNDTTYICRYYNKFGPMLKQETFSDSGLSVPNGLFVWYDEKGNADSMASVYNGRKINFTSFDDNLKPVLSATYKNGNLFEKRDYIMNTCTDSAGNTSSLADKEKEQHDKFLADSVGGETREARFETKGNKQWQKYLDKNLLVPDRFEQVMKEGTYQVILSFLITKDGSVDEVCLLRSCELSADLEVFKVFENSPRWQPAMLKGENVVYRQKQSLSFSVSH
jgi:hypothetical protein